MYSSLIAWLMSLLMQVGVVAQPGVHDPHVNGTAVSYDSAVVAPLPDPNGAPTIRRAGDGVTDDIYNGF
jgi:hypothetical protein